MKYHKIRNVPLEICTAEQKVAYNIAFAASINDMDRYKKAKAVSEESASAVIDWIIDDAIRFYSGKYNIGAIAACLRAGLPAYMEHDFIATSYSQVGKAFPATDLMTA